MTSEDPTMLDQDPMQSWIRRCTLWGGGGGGGVFTLGSSHPAQRYFEVIKIVRCWVIFCISGLARCDLNPVLHWDVMMIFEYMYNFMLGILSRVDIASPS